MTRASKYSPDPDMESLLASERVLIAAPHAERHRALSRARAALQGATGPAAVLRAGRAHPAWRFKLVAIPAALGASWAFAHQAGYRWPGLGTDSAPTVDSAASKPAAPPEPAAALKSTAQVSPEVAPSSAPLDAAQSSAAPKAAVSPGSKPELDAYTQELSVLQPAQRAVAQRDYAAALAPISQHRKRFPFGVLTEEREALRIKALVGLGRHSEAQQAAATFRKRFPKSALQGRVDALLGTEK